MALVGSSGSSVRGATASLGPREPEARPLTSRCRLVHGGTLARDGQPAASRTAVTGLAHGCHTTVATTFGADFAPAPGVR